MALVRLRRALFGSALLVALAGHFYFVNRTIDDAFISFRYAHHLAVGDGLVFNVGERVEGYSNFLWTVLLALPAYLGVERFELGMLFVAKLLGVLFSAATLLVVTRTAMLGRSERERASAPLAALYLATLAPFLAWGVGALETPLVTLLLALTLHSHLREDEGLRQGQKPLPWSYLLLFAAAISRPEPALLFLPLAALRLARNVYFGGPRALPRALAGLALFVLPFAAFIAWRYAYYGQIVPNTYFAKLSGDDSAATRGSFYRAGAFLHMNWNELGVLVVLLTLLAGRVSYRLLTSLVLFASQVAIVVVEGGDWMQGYRLFVPALPFVAPWVHEAWLAVGSFRIAGLAPASELPAWLISPAWVARWRRVVRAWAERPWLTRLRGARCLGYAALIWVLVAGARSSYYGLRESTISGFSGLRLDHAEYFEISHVIRDMRRNRQQKADLLALGEAGIIPYYTGQPVLDLFGLMDPHIAHLSGALHYKFDADYFFARRPSYVFLAIARDAAGQPLVQHWYARVLLGDARFSRAYTLHREFEVGRLYLRSAD